MDGFANKRGFYSPQKWKEQKIMNEDHTQANTMLFPIIQVLLLTLLF